MNAAESGPPSNANRVLSALGRASTPSVPEMENGPSLGSLSGVLPHVRPGSVLLVGTASTAARLQRVQPVVPAVPGMTAEIAALDAVECLVVEARAFLSGQWKGADSHQSRHLAEELFEAGRLLRARGGQALFLPCGRRLGTMGDRLLSTFTADLSSVPAVDLEEGAAQSPLWEVLVEVSGGPDPQGSPAPFGNDVEDSR